MAGPTAPPLRAAVVGVGHLGRHHARLYQASEAARLVAAGGTPPGRGGEGAAPPRAAAGPHSEGLRGARSAANTDDWTRSLESRLHPVLARRVPLQPEPLVVVVQP